MRISHRHKFIYFANPKTGSSALRSLLDPLMTSDDPAVVNFEQTSADNPFYPHMRPIEARDVFRRRGWDFDSYYRFTTVRNPWTRALSLYSHIRADDRCFDVPLVEWLRSTATSGPGGGGPDRSRWRKYGTYALRNFAGDEDGSLLVDDVFRVEDFAAVPAKLRERGVPIDPAAVITRSNARPHVATLTLPAIALIAGRYAEDIVRFDYRPPSPLP